MQLLPPRDPLARAPITRSITSALIVGVLGLLALGAPAAHASPRQHVTIDGSLVEVRWSDGDSLRFLSGRLRGEKARLMGYNTLESYGPVHKWGEWSEWELYKVAKSAREVAERKAWICEVGEERDHYGRYLMRCPELTETMLREGIGHLFEVIGDPPPALLQLQLDAIKEQRGMWRKGAPEGLVTSVHSASEMKEDEPAYNRVATLRTGRANKVFHQETYEQCRWVCAQGSCMLYVPFELRYGDKRPACLRWQGR